MKRRGSTTPRAVVAGVLDESKAMTTPSVGVSLDRGQPEQVSGGGLANEHPMAAGGETRCVRGTPSKGKGPPLPVL
jgi:hypothetical protein